MKDYLWIVLSTLTLAASGCGSATDNVRIKILSNLDSPVQARNLMTALGTMHALNPPPLPKCIQKTLFAGINLTPGGNADHLFTVPVNLITPADLSEGETDIASWLSTNATVPEISIPVPHGATVDFGVVGNLISNSNTTLVSGIDCDPVNASTQTVNPTYSVSGKRDNVTISGDTDVNLGLWILSATSTPAPSAASGTNQNCTASGSSDTCPRKNFLKIQTTCNGAGCTTYNSVGKMRFEYFKGENRTEQSVQYFSLATTNATTGVSLPSIGNITATFLISTSSDTPQGNTVVINKNSFTGNTQTYSIDLGGGASISISAADYL